MYHLIITVPLFVCTLIVLFYILRGFHAGAMARVRKEFPAPKHKAPLGTRRVGNRWL